MRFHSCLLWLPQNDNNGRNCFAFTGEYRNGLNGYTYLEGEET